MSGCALPLAAQPSAIRVPSHPVALALLQATELPIAAPSANRSNRVSPTTAEHVRRGLEGRIDMILDAGPTAGGLESTVIDLTADPPRLLRPGLVTVAQLEAIVGPISVPVPQAAPKPNGEPASLARPAGTPLFAESKIDLREPCDNAMAVCELLNRLIASAGCGCPRWPPCSNPKVREVISKIVEMPSDPIAYSVRLYAALHEMDDAQVELIIVDLPPNEPAWLAIHDRLRGVELKRLQHLAD